MLRGKTHILILRILMHSSDTWDRILELVANQNSADKAFKIMSLN